MASKKKQDKFDYSLPIVELAEALVPFEPLVREFLEHLRKVQNVRLDVFERAFAAAKDSDQKTALAAAFLGGLKK